MTEYKPSIRKQAMKALDDIDQILREYVTPAIPEEGDLADRVDRIHEDVGEIANRL